MLEALIEARSVAVVGASPANGVASNLLAWSEAMGRKVEYWPVNPKYGEVAGLQAYPALAELPGVPDVVAIALGGGGIPSIVDEALAVGAKSLAIYADMRHTGEQAARLRDLLRARSVPLVGSNCVGALSVRRGLALYSGDVNQNVLTPGGTGFISQSGSVLIGVLSAAPRLLFSSVFSVGNEDATTTADYIAFFADDDDTRVIGCFLETVRDPQGFRRAVEAAGRAGKPIVALTVGKTPQGRNNAATHSGALAPDTAVMSAYLRDCGVIEVTSLEALIETLVAFQSLRRPRGPAIGMVHVSGGEASLQLDFGTRNGLSFPPLAEKTLEGLRGAAPWLTAPQNPIDAWGPPSYRDSYPPALEALAADHSIDIVVANQDVGQYVGDSGPHVARFIADALITSATHNEKPAFMVSNVALGFDDATTVALGEAGIPLLVGADAGYAALGHWTRFHTARRTPPVAITRDAPATAPALPARAGALDEVRSMQLLQAYGLRAPRMAEAVEEQELVDAAEGIGYPVVLKGVGTSLLHKTESGAVVTGIRGSAQLRAEIARIRGAAPEGAVTSFIVVEQVERHRELMLGAHRDEQLGVVLLLGVGGIMAEVIADVQLAMAPVDRYRARAMVNGLRSASWLGPWRHLRGADMEALVDAILAFGNAVEEIGDRLESIDVNPVAVLEEGRGCVMLDAVVVLR